MRFYCLEPEVAGGLSENTVMDSSVHPPIVKKLHYQMDGWSGDDLLESFPCYIVTEKIKEKLETLSLSGCNFDNVEVTKSEQFNELYPGLEIPHFYWLKINGKPGIDDFGLSEDMKLIVSERLLKVLKEFKINNCGIEKYEP